MKKRKPIKRKARADALTFDQLCTAVVMLGLVPSLNRAPDYVTPALVKTMQQRRVIRDQGAYHLE